MSIKYPKRFIIAPDPHGMEQDYHSTKALTAFAKDFRPDIAIINGDLFDFAALRKGASEDEKAVALNDDYDAGIEFAESFLTKAPERHLLWGNHDHRIFELCHSANGPTRSLGEMAVERITNWTKGRKVQTYPYDSRLGVLRLGHLNIVHGFFAGQNACAQHARVYGNCVFGHVHSIESYQVPGLDQKEARSIGCLCKLDLPYINTKTAKLRWANGFAYGFLYDDGTYTILQARKINGSFHVATDFHSY